MRGTESLARDLGDGVYAALARRGDDLGSDAVAINQGNGAANGNGQTELAALGILGVCEDSLDLGPTSGNRSPLSPCERSVYSAC